MKRLQNRIAESRFALPVTAVYTLAVWIAAYAGSTTFDIRLAIFAVSAYLMVELNNRNTLIRIYSRMVSCVFLILGTMTAPVIASVNVLAVQLCFIAAYLLLFSCYQDKTSQGRMFYAFVCLGIAYIIFPQTVFFIPLILILTGTNLMAFSARNFWASLIGLTVPYWFFAGYCALSDDFNSITAHLYVPVQEITPELMSLLLKPDVAVSLGFIIIITIIGATHFLRNSYMDKIRTRMIYEYVIVMTVFTAVLIILQPHLTDTLTGIMQVNTSILTAHFIALTKTKATNIMFITILVLALLITLFNGLYNDDSLTLLPPQD